MRVALFTDTFLPEVNGVARTLGRLVAHATGRGHEIGLVTPRVSPEEAVGTVFHRQLAGMPVPIYPELKLARPLDGAGRRMLGAFRPEVVHVATESTVGASGARWALREGIPLVTSFHTNFPAYLAGYGLSWAEGWLWNHLRAFHARARLTFCPSSATRELLRAHGFHDRLRIWSRGVDSAFFHPGRRKESVRQRLAPGADRILLYVGRLAPEKRVDLLVEAFQEIRALSRRRVALVLVGDGPSAPSLRRSATPDIRFTGYLRGIDLAEAYAAGDIFVFPSDTETFGNVVLEAMASGLPVVAPARGGVTETVREGETGVLVPPQHPRAFARAALALLQDEELRSRLSRGARSEAERRSWPVIMDGLLEAWAEVASPPGEAGSRGRPSAA
jgi:phosphatidylinositol alpha 1,6-mannosyltransferase